MRIFFFTSVLRIRIRNGKIRIRDQGSWIKTGSATLVYFVSKGKLIRIMQPKDAGPIPCLIWLIFVLILLIGFSTFFCHHSSEYFVFTA